MYSTGKCCIKYGEGEKAGEALNHIGVRWREDKGKKHPLKTILEHAIKLNLTDLAAVLENNLQNNIPTFIHLICRDKLRNQSRPKRRL